MRPHRAEAGIVRRRNHVVAPQHLVQALDRREQHVRQRRSALTDDPGRRMGPMPRSACLPAAADPQETITTPDTAIGSSCNPLDRYSTR